MVYSKVSINTAEYDEPIFKVCLTIPPGPVCFRCVGEKQAGEVLSQCEYWAARHIVDLDHKITNKELFDEEDFFSLLRFLFERIIELAKRDDALRREMLREDWDNLGASFKDFLQALYDKWQKSLKAQDPKPGL